MRTSTLDTLNHATSRIGADSQLFALGFSHRTPLSVIGTIFVGKFVEPK